MATPEPARVPPLADWRALVQGLAWEAVRRAGEHADLEWLPAVIDARLTYRADLLERAGATDEELAALHEELVEWAVALLEQGRPPTKRGALSHSAWPTRLR